VRLQGGPRLDSCDVGGRSFPGRRAAFWGSPLLAGECRLDCRWPAHASGAPCADGVSPSAMATWSPSTTWTLT
jgi:hypothetical protein